MTIETQNIQQHLDIPFEEYLKMPGYSNSFLKSEKQGTTPFFNVTENVRIGKLVDGMITGEEFDFRDELYPTAKLIADKIKSDFGALINVFQKQVSYTAEFKLGEFVMPSRGRLDFLIPNMAVADLKVTKSKDIESLIKFMGYENQMWSYCKYAKVKFAFLIIHSIPLKKTIIKKIDCSSDYNEFWGEKILKFGTVK
jgi:hypothetical protein